VPAQPPKRKAHILVELPVEARCVPTENFPGGITRM